MARKPDPKLAERKQEALRLKEEGLSLAEIAARFNRSPSTVKEWIRQARGGPREDSSYRARIVKSLRDCGAEGASREELAAIAESVGCSFDHVRRIERKERGFLKRYRRTAEELVADFKVTISDNPAARPPSTSKSFNQALVRGCIQAANDSPAKAQDLVTASVAHFEGLLRARKATTCQLLQILATRAAIMKELDRPRVGLQLLMEALAHHPTDCLFCAADMARREAWIRLEIYYTGDKSQLPLAFARLSRAQAIYKSKASSGHDYYGDGEASCALVEAWLYLYSGDFAEGLRLAAQTLKLSAADDELRCLLLYAYAYALFSRNGETDRATALGFVRDLLRRSAELPNLWRSKLRWLEGELILGLGDEQRAQSVFEDSLDYAQTSASAEGVVAAVTGVGRCLHRRGTEPQAFSACLSGLREHCDRAQKKVVPPFLSAVWPSIQKARARTRRGDDLGRIAADLWVDGRGARFMPSPEF